PLVCWCRFPPQVIGQGQQSAGKLCPFHQNPATHLEEFSARADRPDWGRKNLIELVEQPLPAEEFIGAIVVEKGLAKVFEVKRIVTIDLKDSVNERLFVWKIRIIQKALRVKLGVDLRIAPVDGNTPGAHGVNDLLSCVAGDGSVFKGNVELVGLEKSDLRLQTVPDE